MNMQNSQADTQEIDDNLITMGIISLRESKLEEIKKKIIDLREQDKADREKWDKGEDARFEKWQKEEDRKALEFLRENPNGGKIFGGPQPPDPSPYPQFVSKYGDEIEKLHLEKRQLEKEIAALRRTVAEVPEKYQPYNKMNRTQQEQFLFTSLKKKPDFKERSYYIFHLDEDLSIVALTGNDADGWSTFNLMTFHQAQERKRQLTEQGSQVTEVYELDRRLVGFDPRNETAR